MPKTLGFIVLLFFSGALMAEQVEFPKAGFKIDLLDSNPGNQGSKPLQMLLPSEDGFAPNVTVQVQPFSGDTAAYRELSEKQLAQGDIEVISIEHDDNSVVFEYRGEMMQRQLHFYSRALKKGDYVYLSTATSLETQWAAYSAQLKGVVDSLQ